MNTNEQISFGVAGWSYPDWNGTVYPRGLRDKLGFMACYVDMMEINTTFYRPVDARLAEGWLKQVADQPEFFFSAKIHQEVTHRFSLDATAIDRFIEGLRPLREAGKLRHWLAQYKYDFEDNAGHRDYLSRVRDAFAGSAALVLELRHNSWQNEEALAFLDRLGVTVATLDYPLARNSFNLPVCLVGASAYFRLHGRNSRAWFDKTARRDATYNYMYSLPELNEIRARAARLSKAKKHLTVVANNHYGGKEVANVLQLKALMTGGKVKIPDLLLRAFPELRELALSPAPIQGEWSWGGAAGPS